MSVEQMQFAHAEQIAERILRDTGRAMMENNFPLFSKHFAVPCTLESFDDTTVLRSWSDWRQTFDAVRSYYLSLGMTHLERTCISAEFTAETVLNFVHETKIYNGQELLQDAFPTLTQSHLVDGHWRAVRLSYAIADKPSHNRALHMSKRTTA